jgi:hypothetical protein
MKLSSGPPSLRTIFRSEKMVPKISFASSCAERRAGRARAGPRSTERAALASLVEEMGRLGLGPVKEVAWSRGRAQSLL